MGGSPALVSCTAPYSAPGACGTAINYYYTTAPTTNLCSGGVPTTVVYENNIIYGKRWYWGRITG